MNATHMKAGLYGGLIGGIGFGIMMGMMGMLPMVGSVIGSQTISAGIGYHLFNSLVIGALFAFSMGKTTENMSQGIQYGLIYGAIWWVLGPLLIMPSLMGMGPQLHLQGMQMALPSLFGHLLFGLLMGISFVIVKKRDLQKFAFENSESL